MAYFVNIPLVLVLAITVVASPQSAGTNTPNVRRSKTKVDVKYDKASDMTTVWLAPMTVIHTGGENEREELELSASFSFPKHTIITPASVKIHVFSIYAGGAGFEEDRRLIVTADDERIDLGNMELGFQDSFRPSHDRFPWVSQNLSLSVGYTDFLRVSKARKVQGVVGRKKFTLSSKQLQFLKDFAELMQQQGQEFTP
jgi:hypothetical protein